MKLIQEITSLLKGLSLAAVGVGLAACIHASPDAQKHGCEYAWSDMTGSCVAKNYMCVVHGKQEVHCESKEKYEKNCGDNGTIKGDSESRNSVIDLLICDTDGDGMVDLVIDDFDKNKKLYENARGLADKPGCYKDNPVAPEDMFRRTGCKQNKYVRGNEATLSDCKLSWYDIQKIIDFKAKPESVFNF